MNPAFLARIARDHRSGGTTDPYWEDVVSLMHFDGVQGATTFVDQISSNTWSNISAILAYLDTAHPKFGTACLYLPPTAATIENSVALIDGEYTYTIEGWVYTTAVNSSYNSIISDAAGYTGLYVHSGKIHAFTTNNQTNGLVSSTIALNTWHHVALVSSGADGECLLFLDGVIQQSEAGDSTGGMQWIGSGGAGSLYVDELRITSGVARYAANFTPPTAPFPNS